MWYRPCSSRPRPGRQRRAGATRNESSALLCAAGTVTAPSGDTRPPVERVTRPPDAGRSDDAALSGAPLPGPAERAEWDDTVRWALGQLAPEYREAFLLKHVEDLEYEEMAQLTGAGISALKMRVKRAREQLQIIFREAERV